MDQIIVVRCSEDGDVSLSVKSEQEFLKELNEGEHGTPPKFLKPESYIGDLAARAGMYVFKGKVVEPKPVQRVTEYEL